MDPLAFARANVSYVTDAIAPTEFTRKVNYVLRGDGLWEIRSNSIANFYLQRAEANLIGFTKETYEEGFVLKLPKIPKSVLDTIVSFFRYICDASAYEAYVQIYWRPEDETYYVHCPRQQISKARVRYDVSLEIPTDHLLVCEIHSHNTMKAFFSAIDDQDELVRGDRFFGVIGQLQKATPEILLSFVAGGQRKSVEVFDLFQDATFPAEWLEKIVEEDLGQVTDEDESEDEDDDP